MLRWFSNHLLVPTNGQERQPEDYDRALEQGRLYTAFEILGTPVGLDFHLITDDGTTIEMGGTGKKGTLFAQCPSISPLSPTNGQTPQITATIFKDGEPWASKCGEHVVEESGDYRMRIDLVPYHLQDFLGDEPDQWVQSYPWVYTNPIRVR